MNSYHYETIARQRMEQTAAASRTAHRRHGIEARPRWRFPKVAFPVRRPTTFVPRPV